IWMCWRGWQYYNPARWYWGRQPITGIAEQKLEKPRKFSLDISPNPARDNVMITYTILKPQTVSLKVYSIDGRLLKMVEKGYKNVGTYRLDCSLRDLNSGIYIFRLETEKQSLCKTIVFAK
ncbi:MAG: T9SS type A sorting domain-containing protein, partial [candidate division WOR-3 bacterium]|nr:T9SS type A sorting domain-containing protein [candidate division WOR-3 bacterium]